MILLRLFYNIMMMYRYIVLYYLLTFWKQCRRVSVYHFELNVLSFMYYERDDRLN